MNTFDEFRQHVQATKQDKIRHGSFINRFERFLSVRISWLLYGAKPVIRPNVVSFINVVLIILVLCGPLFFGVLPPYWVLLGQVVVLFCSSIFDKVDGELARAQSHFTQRGIYYDLLYHFLYTFSFYAFLGFFFGAMLPGAPFWYFAVATAFLVTLYKMFGKVRHHVRYKIRLEDHQTIIKDAVTPSEEIDRSWFRFVMYLLYTPYEWTFLLLVVLVVVLPVMPLIAVWGYITFMALLFFVTLYRLLIWYPRHALFSGEELHSETLS